MQRPAAPATPSPVVRPLHVCFLWKRFSSTNYDVTNYDVVIQVNGGEGSSDKLSLSCDLIETGKASPTLVDREKVAAEIKENFKGLLTTTISMYQSPSDMTKFLKDHCRAINTEETRMRFYVNNENRIECLKILFTNPKIQVYHAVNFDELQKRYLEAGCMFQKPGGSFGLEHNLTQATLLLNQSKFITFNFFKKLLLDNITAHQTQFKGRISELNDKIIKLLKKKCEGLSKFEGANDGLRIKELASYIKACSNEILRESSQGLLGGLTTWINRPELVTVLVGALSQIPQAQLDINAVQASDVELAKELHQKSQPIAKPSYFYS